MFSYTAYGLNIQSALPLPELVPQHGKADPARGRTCVFIRFGKVEHLPAQANGAPRYLRATSQGVHFFYQDVGKFFVRHGDEIIVDPAPGVEEETLRLFILGPTLGILLHQRGLPVFHASAVAFPIPQGDVPAGAAAFLAPKGGGKSTLAAALHTRGYDLVADDLIALDDQGGRLLVRPGFPQFKLWPDAVKAIGESPELLPVLRPQFEKRAHRISQGFAQNSLPLRCVFLLDLGQTPEVVPLSSREALLGVMPHWYGALGQGELLPGLGLDRHMAECVQLVKKVPIYALKRPVSLAALTEVTCLIERHLAANLRPDLARTSEVES